MAKAQTPTPTKYYLYKYQHMLKPCPLCGGRARLKTNHDFQKNVDFINRDKKIELPLWYEVFCTNCNLQMSYLKTMDEAVECWNRRAKN